MTREQARGWLLTLPASVYDQDEVERKLGSYSAYVGQLEEGSETGYRHWQMYVENRTPIRFSTLRKAFPEGHFESRRGTKAQAVAYVTKEATRAGVSLQHGVIDLDEEQGRRSDLERFHSAILDEGMSAQDVLLAHPSALRYARMLEVLQAARDQRANSTEREVVSHYVWGAPGVGKTRYAYTEHGSKLYRVTDYAHPFDEYQGEQVLVLDEFTGQLPLDLMLNVLDRYPLSLPARYANRTAAFTEVLVLSNLALDELYPLEARVRRAALQRRFTSIARMEPGGRLVQVENPGTEIAQVKTPRLDDVQFARLMNGG